MTWLPVTLSVLDLIIYNLHLWHHGHWFPKFTVPFWPIRKEIVSSMYNNHCNLHYCPPTHQESRPLGWSNFLSMCRVIILYSQLYSQPIRFVRLDSEHAQSGGKSMNCRLPVSWTFPDVLILGADQKEASLWGLECVVCNWLSFENCSIYHQQMDLFIDVTQYQQVKYQSKYAKFEKNLFQSLETMGLQTCHFLILTKKYLPGVNTCPPTFHL